MLARLLALTVGVSLLLATVQAVVAVLGQGPGRLQVLRPALALVVLCGAWVLVNAPVEGRVLWTPRTNHGLTEADLLVVPPLLVAAVLGVMHLRG